MRRLSRTACAVLLSASSLAACGGEAPPPRQPPPVTVSQPEVRTIESYAIFTGTSRAVESAQVVARVSGRLESIEFEPGVEVEQGQVLFTIERTAYVADRDAAAASVQSAEAELLRAETELRRVTRASANNAVSEMDLDTAKASRDKAEAALLSAKAKLADSQLRLSYTQVVAPISGVVGRNLVDAGNLVGQSGPTLLTTVNKIQPVYVYFHAPEKLVLTYLDWLNELESSESLRPEHKRAAKAYVALANDTGFPHEGVVDFVNNTVDPNTGTIELRVRLENDPVQLFPGLFVRLKVIGGEIPDAVLVPEMAVGSDLGGKYLLRRRRERNLVEQRYIEIGPAAESDGMIHIEFRPVEPERDGHRQRV